MGLLVVVVLLTAVALSPLLRTDQPCTHDGGLHYYRIVAMRHALEDGLLVSRWMPDLAFGYGFPFFNYRAALSYYLGLALYLIGLSLPQALNAVYVLALAASAVGAYLLGRDLFGRAAGVVVAVAYVYAPYAFIDALVRGNLPESLALALLPFILWSFRRLLLSGRISYLLSSAGMLALLWLSHNISSLIFTPFLVLFVLVLWLARGRRDHLAAVGVALVLGIGLTAFYWAPAVLEKDEVQLYLARSARTNDYHYNFVTLSEVLAPPEPADPALLNPPLRLPLGLPLVVLASLGTVLALWRWRRAFSGVQDTQDLQARERWAVAALFAFSALAMIFMATRASVVLWERLPLIPFVQFPWRFVGRAVLPLSLLAGGCIAALSPIAPHATRSTHKPRLPWLAVLIGVALLVLTALPFATPPTGYCLQQARPDVLDLFAYEHATGLVGVDPLGSYFPVTVQTRPKGSPLEAQYAEQLARPQDTRRTPIARFDVESLPDGAVIHHAEYAPNRARLEIETPGAVRARYFSFAFPGWRVLVDGRPAEIIPGDPQGLITFDLPAGRHVVEVTWGSTPVRTVATMLSLVALASVAFVTYTAVRHRLVRWIRADAPAAPSDRPAKTAGNGVSCVAVDALSWRQVALLAFLALLLLGLKLAVVDRTDTLFRRPGLSAGGTLPGVDNPLDVRFDDGIRLLGYERSTETMLVDGTLHLALYWSAYARPSRSYRATVELVGPDGRLWSPKAAFPRRGYADPPPSTTWGHDRYAVTGLDVEALPGTPPGRYDLRLTVFDRQTLAPLDVLDDAGQVAAPNLTVGQVTLTRPSRAPDPVDVPMQFRLGAGVGPLVLAGVNLDRDEAAPGDPMLVTLFWNAVGSALPDLKAHLALVDANGAQASIWELPPVRAEWPTSRWQPGDLWRGQHMLRLPGRLESGTYAWQLQLYEPAGTGSRIPSSPVDLGQLQIDAPERLWQVPPLHFSVSAEFGQQATLLGANLEPASAATLSLSGEPATLKVTLVWQARSEMATSYRVFLHLLTPAGDLLTQSDGEPVNWTRPTSGWAPGEVILDERMLDIPADAPSGRYSLAAGLYDPDTRDRLALPDGTTVVLITTLTLEEP